MKSGWIRRCIAVLAVASATICMGPAFALDAKPGVKLRALDKMTGNAQDIEVEVGKTVEFHGIGLTARACYQSPPEEQPPESAAFLEVFSTKPTTESETADADPRLFSGWMFASSPGLNGLEDPVYDVWVISCTASEPVSTEAAAK